MDGGFHDGQSDRLLCEDARYWAPKWEETTPLHPVWSGIPEDEGNFQ